MKTRRSTLAEAAIVEQSRPTVRPLAVDMQVGALR
jgi:hypothetical protein